MLLAFTGDLPVFTMMEEKGPSSKTCLPTGAKGCSPPTHTRCAGNSRLEPQPQATRSASEALLWG